MNFVKMKFVQFIWWFDELIRKNNNLSFAKQIVCSKRLNSSASFESSHWIEGFYILRHKSLQ